MPAGARISSRTTRHEDWVRGGRQRVLTLAPRVVAPPLTGGQDRSAARRWAFRLRVAFTAAGKLDGAPIPSGERVDSGQLAGGRCSAVAVAGRRRALAPPHAALRAPPLALGPGGRGNEIRVSTRGLLLFKRATIMLRRRISSEWVPIEPRR
ncbi:hypothetical protein GUJ93_ZPchr0009g892 [Zizania palustris]|uniref:Uncharacterized protein n=1 Tax=Zizania palustris TaxID=103762 RepID=A0A8J5R174_ZIZPA|nr:hypothetical protein GUJ93_ZPchr0009g892 [Zizania palustris]